MFCHISSNPATPSRNAASTSNTTLTNHPTNLNPVVNLVVNPIVNLIVNPVVNPVFNPAINLAVNPVLNPPAMPPAPAGMDPTIWVNNQALIMSLLPTLQALTSQNHPPPRPPKEGDAQAPVKFLGDKNSKLRDFLFECGLVFDAKPLTYATDWARVIYAIQFLTGTAKQHFWQDIKQGYWTA